MDTNERLDERLDEKRRVLSRLLESPNNVAGADLLQQHKEITDEVLNLERAIATREGRPAVMPLDWPVGWTKSSVFQLAYSNRSASFEYNRLLGHPQNLTARTTLFDAYAVKCGGPNDELLEAHPLYGQGLGDNGAFLVQNSEWLQEEKNLQSHHRLFKQDRWDKFSHYIWLFHDGQIEAIASGFCVDIVHPR